MGEYQHIIQLEAVNTSGPPMNAYLKTSYRINPGGYDINPMLLDLLHAKRFAGDGTEDPYEHVEFFKEICETFYFNVYTKDEVKFRLFGQTLIDKARSWYDDCPTEITDTWEELSSAFLTDFFPETRYLGARRMITNFKSLPGEGLYEGYSRFRDILNHCPHHEFPPWLIIHTFYAGLNAKIECEGFSRNQYHSINSSLFDF